MTYEDKASYDSTPPCKTITHYNVESIDSASIDTTIYSLLLEVLDLQNSFISPRILAYAE